ASPASRAGSQGICCANMSPSSSTSSWPDAVIRPGMNATHGGSFWTFYAAGPHAPDHRRRAPPSDLCRRERIIDRTPERVMQADAAYRHQLHQQQCGEVVHRVDPEQRAVAPVPEELADLARVLLGIHRRAQSRGEVYAEAPLPFVRHPGPIRDRLVEVVRGHQPHRLRLQHARAAELAFTEQHAREFGVCVDGRGTAKAARIHRPLLGAEAERLLIRRTLQLARVAELILRRAPALT